MKDTVMFPDVPENHWAYEYLDDLQKRGVIEGYPNGQFMGDRAMTRYEFAAMLDRALRKGISLDARAARDLVRAVRPRIVIPMHYKTAVNAQWPIADETEFLRLMNAGDAKPMPLLRVTRGDLSEQPALALLAWGR